MTKFKITLSTIGILMMALAGNGYAMMGGNNGHSSYGDSGHSTYYQTYHSGNYTMAPGYYNQGNHMGDAWMTNPRYPQYSHDRNRAKEYNHNRFRLEYNHGDRTRRYDYDRRQNRVRRYHNER